MCLQKISHCFMHLLDLKYCIKNCKKLKNVNVYSFVFIGKFEEILGKNIFLFSSQLLKLGY